MSEENNTSYAEVQKILIHRVEEANRGTEYGFYNDPSAPPLRYLKVVGDRGATSSPSPQPNNNPPPKAPLAEEHYKFLCDVRDHTEDGMRQRYERLQIGMSKGRRLRCELEAAGYITITEIPVQTSSGERNRLLAGLTHEGLAYVQAYERHRVKI